MSSNPSAAAENPQTNPAEQNQVSFDQFLPVNITPFELSDIIIQWVQQQKLIPGQVANDLKAAPFSGIFIPGYIISFTDECTRPAIDDKLATYCQKLPIIK